MPEVYMLEVDKSQLAFVPSQEKLADFYWSKTFNPVTAHPGVGLVARMGSADLAHCVIFREQGKPGGIFVMHDGEGPQFAAIAPTNLAYALAKGFFGELTVNARTGVDVYAEAEEADD